MGRKTGIDLPGEDPGLIPSPDWKQRVHRTAWYPGETISVSIGQGPVSVTAIQIARSFAGLVAGGQLRQPHLVRPETLRADGFEVDDLRHEEYPMRQSTVAELGRAMWSAVNESGTASRARIPGFDVAGKTGTTQVVGRTVVALADEYKDHAWFVGFAPYPNPQIVVGVFVENGGSGGVTGAPIARAVMQVYYDKKVGQLIDRSSIGVVQMDE